MIKGCSAARVRNWLYWYAASYALVTFALAAAFIGTTQNDCKRRPLSLRYVCPIADEG